MNGIKFPIEVSSIKNEPLYKDINNPSGWLAACGDLVQVRPVGEKYKEKTYLGILLGDLPLEVFIMHNRETKELKIEPYRNPAIFVPELKEIIWGCGSWWSEIESEEELRQISNDDIQNVWYVKLLKATIEKKMKEQEKK
jgi:hypothetical protein